MFEIGQQVVYGIHGVCTITGREQEYSAGRTTEYLVLEPLNQAGSRFLVPTHNGAAMSRLKPMLTREELEQLLASCDVHTSAWIAEEGQRKQYYRELINSGDRVQLMAMVHTLYQHKRQQLASGRKVHLCDENFLRDAEKLLASELSVVMDMETDAAKTYIRARLQK